MTIGKEEQSKKLAGQAVPEGEAMFRPTAGLAGRFGNFLDPNFTRWLGKSTYGGSSIGECFEVASHVDKEESFPSYYNAWRNTAQRIEDLAKECLKKGHKVSAREAFLRASMYWNAYGMFLNSTNTDYRNSYQHNHENFQAAAKLFNPAIEEVKIPYENGRTIPAYFIQGSVTGEKRPTLMVLGGGENALEDTYYQSAAGASRRGFNALMMEVPGQKAMTYEYPELPFRPDVEVPIGYAIDWLEQRNDVDPKRIAIAGHSMGGYFAGRAAVHDKRIAACILAPMISNVAKTVLPMTGFDPSKPYPRDMESQLDAKNSLAQLIAVTGDFRERLGVADKTLAEMFDFLMTFTYEDDLENLTCPVLELAGEGEFGPKEAEEHRVRMQRLPNSKNKFRIATAAEGGELHCMANNLPLKNQIEGDWLTEVLDWTE